MCIDIVIANDEKGNISRFNTLRNPFGLFNWIEMGLEHVKEKPEKSLEYICTEWANEKSDLIDRKLFL